MNIKENVQKGVISNIIGIIIVVASVASVFVPALEIDWTNAAIGMGVGLGVIGLSKK